MSVFGRRGTHHVQTAPSPTLGSGVAGDGAAASDGAAATERRLPGDDALVDAYRFLQLCVGIIAILLAFVPPIGAAIIDGEGLKSSISAYYYTSMGAYFVGSMCALGVVFASYRHKPRAQYKRDNQLSNVAGILAVMVALLPTSTEGGNASGGPKVVAWIHVSCAAVLLLVLAYLSYFLFTKPKTPKDSTPRTRRKLRQNCVYRACGVLIAGAVALIGLLNLLDAGKSWHASFYLEASAVVLFGVSWLVKSELVRVPFTRREVAGA
jgi:hypothetical protein